MLSVSTMASAQSLPAGFVGYNEAWIENNYSWWLASDPLFGEPSAFNNGSLVSPMFSGMAKGNARIVRIWLFPALQGICVNTSVPGTCPQGATLGLTVVPGTTPPEPEFLENLTTVFGLAQANNLKLYITALNANDASGATPSNCHPTQSWCSTEYTYYKNLFSNSAATLAYEQNVLAPILSLMSKYPGVIYGFDLINEIEAAINAGYFPSTPQKSSWTGARTWIQNMTAFVKSYNPCPAGVTPCPVGQWLPVTSTAGGGYAVQDVTMGHFSGLGLNFYDVHVYSNSGTSWGQSALCTHTPDPLPFVLGEYGQNSSTVNQNTVTTNFLNAAKNAKNAAKSSCFSSALAWKYEAVGTSAPYLSYLSITSSGALSTACPSTQMVPGPACARPAYFTIKNFVP